MTRAGTLAIGALVLAVALGACGRKGDLEPPPGMDPARAATQDRETEKANNCASEALSTESSLIAPATPVDASPGDGAESGNPNRMEDDIAPPC
jgi:predicted small lipoprotein YifL